VGEGDTRGTSRPSHRSSIEDSDNREILAHRSRHSAAWCVHPFMCDSQSAVASCSSDGSMRCAFTSTSELAHRSRLNDTNYVNSLDQWTLEDFRITKLENQRQDSSEMNQPNGIDSNVVAVSVSTGTLKIESNLPKLSSHGQALHAIDSTPLTSQGDFYSLRLFAYGGAAGLLRIHSIDLLKEIVNL
jgi:hypothetical protein